MAKTHLVTGATDGIGLETAHQLGVRGHRVLVHGRTQASAAGAIEALRTRHAEGSLEPVWGDLSVMAEVRGLAAQVQKLAPTLDVLINNAAVFSKQRTLTADGSEQTLAVNYLAPFLLTHALLPQLRAAPAARVVNVASVAHVRGDVDLSDLDFERNFSGYRAYATTKLMLVLFTRELAARLQGSGVSVNALHPGVITTKLLRAGFDMSAAPVEEGARTPVFCATAPELEGVSGAYFADAAAAEPSAAAKDSAMAQALYELTCQRLGIAPLSRR
jgi:NAD(P)-dependent dehydrogenase (short-subunit alcohol dehydrogenase family)